ncbi:MAG: fibronectin type III-like domain-contianing protein, partial [Bariatricus sp.]
AGSSIEMPWHYCCRAILHGYLNGQAGATAMLNILTGKVNPSGRLSETYPIRYEDTPAFRYFPGAERNAEHREGIYVGYRYFDTSKVRVQYPFGYGLSYTDFEYSDIQIDPSGVTFTLANTGNVDGTETAQMYVGMAETRIFRPTKELKGFRKVFLKAGESKKVSIPFDDKTFRYWNAKTNQWEIEGGTYQIMIGASVADIRLSVELKKTGTTEVLPYDLERIPSYCSGLIQKVPDSEFEHLLGHPIPHGKWAGELGVNDAICQMYYAKSGLARLIYRILTNMKKKSEAKGKPDLNILFIYNMPFRGIAKMTGGAVDMEMVQGMVQVVNGHFFKGMKRVIVGFFANARKNKKYRKLLMEVTK